MVFTKLSAYFCRWIWSLSMIHLQTYFTSILIVLQRAKWSVSERLETGGFFGRAESFADRFISGWHGQPLQVLQRNPPKICTSQGFEMAFHLPTAKG